MASKTTFFEQKTKQKRLVTIYVLFCDRMKTTVRISIFPGTKSRKGIWQVRCNKYASSY